MTDGIQNVIYIVIFTSIIFIETQIQTETILTMLQKKTKLQNSEAVMAVNIMITVFRNIMTWSFVEAYQNFEETYFLHGDSRFFWNIGTHLPN